MAIHHPAQPPSKPCILFSAGATSYELVRYLGARGAGELLLARRHYADTPGGLVLVKRLQDPGDEYGRARLREEVKLLMRLSHPAIAQVYLVRVHEGSPHLVMEYVDGHCLETLSSFAALRHRPFSEDFAAYVGAEVADALDHAHSLEDAWGRPLGIVHRDVSPRTIRLDSHGRVKLSDFALAWSLLPSRVATDDGVVRGDLAYAAPEALLRRPLDGRADLFSLGVVLLELLTGLHLLDLEDVERAAQRAEPLPEVEGLRSEEPSWLPAPLMAARMACVTAAHVERATEDLSEPLRAVLRQALRLDPADRFQTGAQLRDALRAVLDGRGQRYGPREAEREAAQARREVIAARRRSADLVERGAARARESGEPRE